MQVSPAMKLLHQIYSPPSLAKYESLRRNLTSLRRRCDTTPVYDVSGGLAHERLCGGKGVGLHTSRGRFPEWGVLY